MGSFGSKSALPSADRALAGRQEAMAVAERHYVLDAPLAPPFPPGTERALFGMGCFWGAEKLFWKTGGVYSTAVGYAGGFTPNPTYQEVCSGGTGHAEVVQVIFEPATLSYQALLALFWEGHDPTQGMRQGGDSGTQYRSTLYTYGDEQGRLAEHSRAAYQDQLAAAGYATITTELGEAPPFYYAEDYHQQYLAKNPQGYCGIGGTGVSCPTGLSW